MDKGVSTSNGTFKNALFESTKASTETGYGDETTSLDGNHFVILSGNISACRTGSGAFESSDLTSMSTLSDDHAESLAVTTESFMFEEFFTRVMHCETTVKYVGDAKTSYTEYDVPTEWVCKRHVTAVMLEEVIHVNTSSCKGAAKQGKVREDDEGLLVRCRWFSVRRDKGIAFPLCPLVQCLNGNLLWERVLTVLVMVRLLYVLTR